MNSSLLERVDVSGVSMSSLADEVWNLVNDRDSVLLSQSVGVWRTSLRSGAEVQVQVSWHVILVRAINEKPARRCAEGGKRLSN